MHETQEVADSDHRISQTTRETWSRPEVSRLMMAETEFNIASNYDAKFDS